MKLGKSLVIASVCLALALVTPAPVSGFVLLSAQTTNVSSTPQSIMTATAVYVQVRSTSTSQAVVTIQQSLDLLNWTTVATINNPTNNGEIWLGPGGGFLQVTIGSYTSGTITVTANAVRGPDTLF